MKNEQNKLLEIVMKDTEFERVNQYTCKMSYVNGWNRATRTIQVWRQTPNEMRRPPEITVGFEVTQSGNIYSNMEKAMDMAYEEMVMDIQANWPKDVITHIIETDAAVRTMDFWMKQKTQKHVPSMLDALKEINTNLRVMGRNKGK